jgi:hypothetical protein
MPPDQIDMSASTKGRISVQPEEHPEERIARFKAEERTARIEDYKGAAVFVILLAGLVAVGILSAYEGFFDPAAPLDTRRWAQTMLASLMAGAVSFVVGRKVGK